MDELLKGGSIGALYAILNGIDPYRLALLVKLAKQLQRMPFEEIEAALRADVVTLSDGGAAPRARRRAR